MKNKPIGQNAVEKADALALTGKARRLANLKPAWQKGQPSANPGGRPKTADLREKVLQLFNADPEGCIERLFRERIDLFFAYGFGKPTESIQISGPDNSRTEVFKSSAKEIDEELARRKITLPE